MSPVRHAPQICRSVPGSRLALLSPLDLIADPAGLSSPLRILSHHPSTTKSRTNRHTPQTRVQGYPTDRLLEKQAQQSALQHQPSANKLRDANRETYCTLGSD